MHNEIIKQALRVMEESAQLGADKLNSSRLMMDYCRLQLGNEKDEVFAVLFLDNNLKLIKFEKFFYGSVNQSSVHLRPIVRRMLELNAAHIVFCHNHPSGATNASNADIEVTREFSSVLNKLDCKVIDHIIVSSIGSSSMVEDGISLT